jgi:hypothetical protein
MENAIPFVRIALMWAMAIIHRTSEPASLLLAGTALIAIGAAIKKTQKKV